MPRRNRRNDDEMPKPPRSVRWVPSDSDMDDLATVCGFRVVYPSMRAVVTLCFYEDVTCPTCLEFVNSPAPASR